MQRWVRRETNACFLRSKSRDFNAFLIHSNALNIPLWRNLITLSLGNGFLSYENKLIYLFITQTLEGEIKHRGKCYKYYNCYKCCKCQLSIFYNVIRCYYHLGIIIVIIIVIIIIIITIIINIF